MKEQRRFLHNEFAKLNSRTEGEDSSKRVIGGHAAVFFRADNPGTEYDLSGDGSVVERIAPGAFDDAIKNDDVVAVFNHNIDYLLGRNTSGTLRLKTDDVGLYYEVDLPNTNWGRDTWESISRKDIYGSSFAFFIEAEREERINGKYIYTIERVSLRDVSPVTFPAYKASSVSLRSCDRVTRVKDEWRLDLIEKQLKFRRRQAKLT